LGIESDGKLPSGGEEQQVPRFAQNDKSLFFIYLIASVGRDVAEQRLYD
jgi:hypothetical protein